MLTVSVAFRVLLLINIPFPFVGKPLTLPVMLIFLLAFTSVLFSVSASVWPVETPVMDIFPPVKRLLLADTKPVASMDIFPVPAFKVLPSMLKFNELLAFPLPIEIFPLFV